MVPRSFLQPYESLSDRLHDVDLRPSRVHERDAIECGYIDPLRQAPSIAHRPHSSGSSSRKRSRSVSRLPVAIWPDTWEVHSVPDGETVRASRR